jgi:hypothetical protein
MATITNTFSQGMDRDSSIKKYDNVHYFDARNMRIVTQEGLSGGAQENLRGTQQRLDTDSGSTNNYICGHVVMNDHLVLWTTDNNTAIPNLTSVDRIWKVDIDDIESLTLASILNLTETYYHLGGNLLYEGNLELCTGNLISSIARYESSIVQKVYWVDGYNRLRHLNTVYNADTNDLTSMSVDKLEVVGNIEMTAPVITELVNGNLKAGKIQYVYQLYSLHGAETVFSPTSGLINLVNYSEVDTTSENYRGSELDEDTGKAVKGTIDINSTGYTRLRIVAIHYTTSNNDPEIRIFDEREISGNIETIIFIDTGLSLGSLILEDIRTVGTILFSAGLLETKDNILFPSNIVEEYFNVDFDARAYRFGGANATSTEPNYNELSTRRNISRVYQEDDSYFLIYGAAITRLGAGGTAAKGDWEYYDAADVYQSTHPDYDQSGYGTAWSIPEDADAINKFNDLDNDGNHEYRYMYQADGIVPGGEGPNVSYKFKIKETTIDEFTGIPQELYTVPEGTVDNPSYEGYASPYNVVNYLGYHRDEIYRFGVVFFDEKGRASFVKWIADIRMPSISTISDVDMYNLTGGSGGVNQEGTIYINYEGPYNDYRIQIRGSDGNIYTFSYDNSITDFDRTMVGNIIRNMIAGHPIVGNDVTQSANVGGLWTIKWDKNPGSYYVNDYGGTYINYTETFAYTPGTAASADHTIAWYDSNVTKGNILHLQFELSNLPSEAESYQIVRVKRESADRTVMAQGIVGPTQTVSGYPRSVNWTIGSSTLDIHTFASPEVAFNKNLTQRSSDRLQEVGEFSTNVAVDTYLTDLILYRYYAVNAMNNPQLPETPGGAGSAAGDENDITSKTTIYDGKIVTQEQVEAIIGTNIFYVNNPTDHTDKGISFVFGADNTSWRSKNTAYDSARKLINYRRNSFSTIYGGLTFNNRKQNTYMVASDIQDIANTSILVFGGDTYIGMFDYLYSSWEQDSATSTQPEVIYFPVETSINLPLRLDNCYHRIFTTSDLIHESAGIWSNGIADDLVQPNDLYRYNTVYSKENDTKIFIQAPFDFVSQLEYPVRTYASDIKTTNELSDSWLNFRVNSYKDVDPQWGEITKLITVNEKLLFFQPRAFGILSVNERALLQTTQISQLSLGTSGVLDRFDYAKTNVGASDKRHVLLTANGLYWIDAINKALYKYTGGPEEVSIMKGMDSYFRSAITTPTHLQLFNDPEFNEIWVNNNVNNWSLVYNELTDAFTGFFDYYPSYVINYRDKVLGSRDHINFFKHNDVYANRGYLYGSYVDSSITLLINPQTDVAIFNNLAWLSELYAPNGTEVDSTFTRFKAWNTYQGTLAAGIALTPNVNVKRRMRKWRYAIPRARYEPDGATAKLRRDSRFRDTHLFIKLTYTNDVNDRRFVAHDIITSYTPSNK